MQALAKGITFQVSLLVVNRRDAPKCKQLAARLKRVNTGRKPGVEQGRVAMWVVDATHGGWQAG